MNERLIPAEDILPKEAFEPGAVWRQEDVADTHGEETATWEMGDKQPDGTYELKHAQGGIIYRTKKQLGNDNGEKKATVFSSKEKGWRFIGNSKAASGSTE